MKTVYRSLKDHSVCDLESLSFLLKLTEQYNVDKAYKVLKKDHQKMIVFYQYLLNSKKDPLPTNLRFFGASELTKNTHENNYDKSRYKSLLSMLIGAISGLLVCVITLVFFSKELKGEVIGILSTISGIFGACLKDTYAFEFGSSRGSREKDGIVSSLITTVKK
jgi:hypothetical protein